MKTFLSFVLGYSRKTLLLIVVLGAASGMASASVIAVVSQLFVNARELTRSELIQGAALLGSAAIAALLLEVFARFVLTSHAAKRHRDLHISFAHVVLNESLQRLERTGIARLITIYTDDMSVIGTALISVSSVGTSVFVVLGCLIYLAWISAEILLLMLLAAIPSIWVYRRLHRHSVSLARASFEERDAHVKHFRNIAHGIKELQLSFHKRRSYVHDEFLPTVYRHEKAFVRSHLMSLMGSAWMQLMYFGLMIVALVYIIFSSTNPEILAPFLVVALFMRSFVMGLLTVVPVWSRAGVVLNRLQEEGYAGIGTRMELRAPGISLCKPSQPLTLEIKDLVYRYRSEENNSPFTVGPLSLSLSSGELVFVVGHNGAGKTTFAKLLSGLYENEAGCIECNGTLIDADNRGAYRELFSALFTDPFVFEALTIADDGMVPDVAIEGRIAEYLERLQLSYKVSVKNRRLDTTELSHGQKKRLALLAAYLENKSVVIFDEWAENQDPLFKHVFYHELLPELRARGKLVIVISHESQFFSVADRVITLNAHDARTCVQSDLLDTASSPAA